MSGYDQLRQAREFARERELEYKQECKSFICTFCEQFATLSLSVDCGRDERIGVDEIRKSDREVAYIYPPFFEEDNAAIWIRVRVDSHSFDVAVWKLGDTFLIKTLGCEFNDSQRDDAYTFMKDSLLGAIEDRLDDRMPSHQFCKS